MASKEDVSVVSLMNMKRIEVDSQKRCYVVDDDDHYRMYLRVHTDDLDALSNSDKVLWMDQFAQMLRTYTGDLKLQAGTTRVDTTKQQIYYRRLMLDANRQLTTGKQLTERGIAYWQSRRALAQEVLNRDINIGESAEDLKFYIVVFGETKKALLQGVKLLIRSGGQTFKQRHVTEKELEEVIARFCNLNEE